MNESICKICGNKAEESPSTKDQTVIVCAHCGRYSVTGSFFIEDYTKDKTNFYKVSSWIHEQNDLFQNYPIFDYEKFEEILNIRDKKIQEKFDLMIGYLFELGSDRIDEKKLIIESWIKDEREFFVLYQKALDYKLIKGSCSRSLDGGGAISFTELTFDGLEYIESLETVNQSSKNIFVAFNFEEELKEVFNTHLKQAIEKEGFNYVIVNQDNVEHNKSINDEIIVKLKSSRIVIADFTNHRNSVYFEAGFAMGMSIPIIWTCQEEHDKEMSFDTRQFPHIFWKNKDDLVKQVVDRIKVIL